MSYLGYAQPNAVFQGVRTASFNGTGSQTVFTLPAPASSAASLEVVVNNVQQSPYDGSYSVSGSTLTFSEAPSSGTNNIYVAYRDSVFMSTVPGDGSVTTSKLANGAVTQDKLAAGAGSQWTRSGSDISYVAGNVGVGTASPQNQLHVSGAATGYARFQSTNRTFTIGSLASAYGFVINDVDAGQERMRIDAAGCVTIPSQPAFIAVKSGNQIPNTTATTKVTYEVTELNTGGAYNTSTSRFTAPVAGNYLFIILFNPYNISNALYNVYLYKNGSGIRNLARGNMSSDSDLCLPSSVVLNLSANDYIEIYVQIADTSWGISGGGYWNSFSGYLLG